MNRSARRTPKVFNSSYRPKQPKTRDWQKYRALLPLGYVVVSGLVLWSIFRLPAFQIKNVIIDGDKPAAVQESLEGLKGTLIFSSHIETVRQKLLHDHLEVEDIVCRRGLPNTLRCQITLSQPVLVWKKGDAQYLVDQNGLLYANKSDSATNFPVVEDRSPIPATIGQVVASPQAVNNIQHLATALSSKGYQTQEFFITETLYQIGAVLTGVTPTGTPFPAKQPINVLFITTYSLDDQVKALSSIFKNNANQINEYVDLRVAGYAYYK